MVDQEAPEHAASRPCHNCGETAPATATYCTRCGAEIEPEILLEVETGRQHVRDHASQLRFRLSGNVEPGCGAALEAVLSGGPGEIEQRAPERRQTGRLDGKGGQAIFAFRFRPLVAGEFPLDRLRLSLLRADKPDAAHRYDLPDRSFFVRVADPELEGRQQAGIRIEGGIHVNVQDILASDMGSLFDIRTADKAQQGRADTGWQPIELRFTGTTDAAPCQAEGCDGPAAADEAFTCAHCSRTLCPSHADPARPGHCTACAEQAREEEFAEAISAVGAQPRPDPASAVLGKTTHAKPPFRARIWTEGGGGPARRDLAAVPRRSKGVFRIGDSFALNAQSERDCYLTLVDVGTSGNVYLLLQNHPLRAGAPVSLSGPDKSKRWLVNGPPGVERIKAFFTLRPVSLVPEKRSFAQLSPEETREISRHVSATRGRLGELPAEAWTDATCEFVIK